MGKQAARPLPWLGPPLPGPAAALMPLLARFPHDGPGLPAAAAGDPGNVPARPRPGRRLRRFSAFPGPLAPQGRRPALPTPDTPKENLIPL